MRPRINLFVKLILFLFLLIACTLMFYGLAYEKDTSVITNQIKASDRSQLEFFTQEMDKQIDELVEGAYLLRRDPNVMDYKQLGWFGSLVNPNQTMLYVLKKLALQTGYSDWDSRLSIYHVQRKETLSSDSNDSFDETLLESPLPSGWELLHFNMARSNEDEFRFLMSDPADAKSQPASANLILEVRFPVANLQRMLDSYPSQTSGGDTFLYEPKSGIITRHQTNTTVTESILKKLQADNQNAVRSEVIEAVGKRYLVSIVPSSAIGWQVIHYSPLDEILSPLRSTRFSFLSASAALLLLSIVFSLMLFRQVQRPIGLLLQAVHRLKEEQWSTRIRTRSTNEFTILNEEFNSMAGKIQSLIERVYMEQLRAKEAYLKQLQSQINPHFLYNCLNFVKSKAKIGDTDSVEAMALNLSDYYRYMTRMDQSLTTVREEIKLLQNYLAIQNLRKERITYEIHMPEDILSVPIPRLLIQPLVENSIVHGIDVRLGKGRIVIHGACEADHILITVDDDGEGIHDSALEEITRKLNATDREDGSFGLWNVNQRLKHHFGKESRLEIKPSTLGGIQTTLYIYLKEEISLAPRSTSR